MFVPLAPKAKKHGMGLRRSCRGRECGGMLGAIVRNSVNENWNEINPGSLSAGLLWGDSNDIQENLKDYMKEFNIT
jgi:hypothetical protein